MGRVNVPLIGIIVFFLFILLIFSCAGKPNSPETDPLVEIEFENQIEKEEYPPEDAGIVDNIDINNNNTNENNSDNLAEDVSTQDVVENSIAENNITEVISTPAEPPTLPDAAIPELTVVQAPEPPPEIPVPIAAEEPAIREPLVQQTPVPVPNQNPEPVINEIPQPAMPEAAATIAENIVETPALPLLPGGNGEVSTSPAMIAENPEIPPAPPTRPPDPPPFIVPAEPPTPPAARDPPPALPINPLPEAPARPPLAPLDNRIVFSRVVHAQVGHTVEIPFSGTGWVYLGELENRPGLRYDSRRMDFEAGTAIGMSFIFQGESPGSYAVQFYRQDLIQDRIINDHVQVILGDASQASALQGGVSTDPARQIIAAPRWPPVPGAQQEIPFSGTADDDLAQETLPTDESQADVAELLLPQISAPSEILPQEEYIRLASFEFVAGRIGEALSILDDMRQNYPLDSDESLWLYGQFLEANSPSRDIRRSLESYQKLVSEFPQSTRVQDAQRRIAYLQRFFFNIQ